MALSKKEIENATKRAESLRALIGRLKAKGTATPGQKAKINAVYNSVSKAGRTLQACGHGEGSTKTCSNAGRNLKQGDFRGKPQKKGFLASIGIK